MNPNLLWLIPTLPFAGFLLNGTLGRKLPRAAERADQARHSRTGYGPAPRSSSR